MMPITMTPDGTAMAPGDEKLLVRFYLKEELNEARTKEAGMNKYDDMEMVEITIPGCRDNCIRKASDQDKQRFRRQYEAFLTTKGEGKEGTPLNHFPFIGPSERRELEYFNIFTGEGLVGLSDGYLERIPLDLRPLIKKVKAFMDMAKDSAISLRQAEENEELKMKIASLEAQMKEIASTLKEKDISHGDRKDEIDPYERKLTKKRGRPSNAHTNGIHQAFTA